MFQGSRNVASGEHFSALMNEGAPQCDDVVRPDQLLRDHPRRCPRPRSLARGRPPRLSPGRGDPGEPRQPAGRRQGGEAPAIRQRPLWPALIDIYATVFPEDHPYHHPTIGSMEDLDAATLEDVHAFYRAHYGPNNTVLTLVGDISPEQGFAAAEQYFGLCSRSICTIANGCRSCPPSPSRSGSTGPRTSRTTASTSRSGCRSTRRRSTTPARSPST